ncbi:hypothetical protein [Nonomuraea africana]|uniref:Uncharacterized protein n=1 Tax=Nonomuraea africana TaxID=46171 RepID=A0ABR9KV74_9ACTN|nr:hypothetical protein [Nonomuraea africana]MBE1565929.1 hypothetical protein [Nonomuraea africana]
MPLTETTTQAGTPAAESRLLPPTAATALTARARDEQLRRRASTSLLGLTDPASPAKRANALPSDRQEN